MFCRVNIGLGSWGEVTPHLIPVLVALYPGDTRFQWEFPVLLLYCLDDVVVGFEVIKGGGVDVKSPLNICCNTSVVKDKT